MAKETDGRIDEAELFAPDLDEGELDVERYTLPDADEISDPYLRKVWAAAAAQLSGGTIGPPEHEDAA